MPKTTPKNSSRQVDSIVKIFVTFIKYNWQEPYRPPKLKNATGTGFIVDKEGHIVTASHVVEDAVDIFIEIPSNGRKKLRCALVGCCPALDIGLIKIIEPHKNLRPIHLADSDTVQIGDQALTYGFPLGQRNPIITMGVVSGRENNLFQMDATINPGNSGGPLLNLAGEVIGINVSGNFGYHVQATNFAVPINQYKSIAKQLTSQKQTATLVRPPFAGFVYYNAADRPDGVYVSKVFKGSPADIQLNLKEGDLVTHINSLEIDNYGLVDKMWLSAKIELDVYMALLDHDAPVKITYISSKDGKSHTKSFLLSDYSPQIKMNYPLFGQPDYEIIAGIVLMDLNMNLVKQFNLIKYASMTYRDEKRVIIVDILGSSQVAISEVFEPGQLLTPEITDLQKLRKHIMKSGDTITLTNEYDEQINLTKNDLVIQSVILSEMYKIPLTQLQMKMIDAQKKMMIK